MTDNRIERHIVNPVTGDRISFIQSPMMGDGDMLAFRCWQAPDAKGSPRHVHANIHETFHIESGVMEFDIGNATHLLGPGESICVQPGTVHGFRNALASEACFVSTATPGIELEGFLRRLYDLAADGVTDADGNPRGLRDVARTMHGADVFAPGLPRRLQKALMAALVWLDGPRRAPRHVPATEGSL